MQSARRHATLYLCCLLSLGASTALAGPPKVVRVTPEDGDFNVDPDTSEIRVEFDQDMSHGGHSVCGGGDWFPKLTGEPHWAGARVFVLPVRLEPNHDYGFNLNCPSARNFRGRNGVPAVDYSVNFATRGGTSLVPPAKHRTAFQELRRAIDEAYSYRKECGVDWNVLFAEFESPLCQATTPDQFGRYAGRMLARARDIHISVKMGDRWFASHRRAVPPNMDFKRLPQLVPGFAKRSNVVYTGRFPDDIGYLLIASWDNLQAEALEPLYTALEEFSDCSGLIIDVRPNSGGSETLAQEFAGCFVDKPVVYAKHVTCDRNAPGGFTAPISRVLEPARNRPSFRGRVAVLTGRHVMSSCEAFLLMMKTVPDCQLVGETSYGSSGNPKPHQLANGITVFLPSWKAMTPDGSVFERQGIPADIEVKVAGNDSRNADPILNAARQLLRK